jgi:hypothetical protein
MKIQKEAKKLTWERFLEVMDVHDLLLYDKKGRIRGYENKTYTKYGPSAVFAWANRKFGKIGFKQCEEFFFRLDELENEYCKNKK